VNSSTGTDGTWEDNWLFKKRKLKTENQSIAMLVPSPTEEIKALIGDKNADETSDLSENEDEIDGKARKLESFTSLDTRSPLLIEATNNLLLVDEGSKNPQLIQKVNIVLSEPLTIEINKSTEEAEFDSIVSPTQVREHKKSIDEQFEKLLMDDNNNNNVSAGSELFLSPEHAKKPAEK
jgi:hypothetical protein